MDPNISTQPQQPLTLEVKPPIIKSALNNPSKFKYGLFGLLILLILIAVGGGAYYLGTTKQQATQKNTNNLTATITPIPTNTTTPAITMPIGLNTISYANVNGKIILQYQGKFFDKNKNGFEVNEINLPNENNYKWIGLVDRPQSETSYVFDEMFSFDTLSDNTGFIFVMRWETNPKNLNGGLVNATYKVFYFDIAKNKLSNILSFQPINNQYQIPKIDKISLDGKFVSFNMFGCWNCGGHYPETLLLNLETNKTKILGKVKDFTWGEKGSYSYKEYKIIECAEPGPGQCSEDSVNLPLINGQF